MRFFNDFLQADSKNIKFFIITSLFLTLGSCVTNKQAVYVQPRKDMKSEFKAAQKKTRTIQPGDDLYITINSEDQESNIFNSQQNTVVQSDISLISYHVNEKGFIRIPPLGNLLLMDLSLVEAANVIEKALIGIIATPSVTVNFINKTITVLGAVNHPGRFEFSDQQINIFQALGYAGDISTYGNRKKVMLIREQNGIILRKYIDLTNEDLLSSSEYYLKPNDIVYVKSLKRRHLGMDPFPFGLVLSIISTTILILSYLNIYRP